ncbi:MAG: hypothetical protein QM820_35935 [Minicystis sp.]
MPNIHPENFFAVRLDWRVCFPYAMSRSGTGSQPSSGGNRLSPGASAGGTTAV